MVESLVLIVAIGFKVALLAFIFHDKIIAALAGIKGSQSSRQLGSAIRSKTQSEQQNFTTEEESSPANKIELTTIDCSQEDSEAESSEEVASIIDIQLISSGAEAIETKAEGSA